MKLTKKNISPFGVLLFALFLFSCSRSATKPEYILTYSVFFPATHIHAKLARQWADEIGKRSNGRIRIDVYPGGILSSATENYECTALGVSDIGMSCFAYSRGMFPMVAGLDLPWGYHDGKEATHIANQFIEHFKPKELQDCVIMYVHAHGPGVLAGNKKITTMNSIHGLNIRSTGISAQIARAMKANAIGMGQRDTYESLRKGVVDCTLCPIETLKGWRQGEVIQYVTRIPAIGYTTTMFVAMNPKSWQKLPPDLQKIIREVNREWIPKHGQAWDSADDKGTKMVLGLHKKINTIAPHENDLIQKNIEPLLKNWERDLQKK
ncbi:MAG: TRAP transporter substrate-binding protein, partial [Lentisphaeria bacterium]